MKDTLVAGLNHEMTYVVPAERTVPNLLPEAPEFSTMPNVLATGFMVGIIEWACMELLTPHLEEGEISLGTHVNLSHDAPTVPGATVKIQAKLVEVNRRSLTFEINAVDDHNTISVGTHKRGVVNAEKFLSRLPETPAS